MPIDPEGYKRVDFKNGQMDFIGLEDNEKPTPRSGAWDESEDYLAWGSTYYEVDTGKLFIYWNEEWYEQP